MPFTGNGLIPDIIVNPNAFPKRMTIGQLIECVVGKIAATKGHNVDATPFNKIDRQKIAEALVGLGYDYSGKEYLYNGMNGKKLKAMIFIGPTYYQRLKHMVDDKIHARARGPYCALTRRNACLSQVAISG